MPNATVLTALKHGNCTAGRILGAVWRGSTAMQWIRNGKERAIGGRNRERKEDSKELKRKVKERKNGEFRKDAVNNLNLSLSLSRTTE
jgi:hypothetical protein